MRTTIIVLGLLAWEACHTQQTAGQRSDWTWEVASLPPGQSYRYHIALTYQRALYIVGGDNNGAFVRYQPDGQIWTSLPALPTPRMFLTGTVHQEALYAMGGLTESLAYSDIVEKYDFSAGQWVTCPTLPIATSRFAAVTVDDQIYCIGGLAGQSDRNFVHSAKVYAYDPVSEFWTEKAELPYAVHGHSAVAHDGGILVFGGYTPDGPTSRVLKYQPATNTWTSRAAMPTPRGFLGVVMLNNNAIAFGGRGRFAKGPVERYDIENDRWEVLDPLPEPRMRFGAAALEGQIYLIGGEQHPDSMLIGKPRE